MSLKRVIGSKGGWMSKWNQSRVMIDRLERTNPCWGYLVSSSIPIVIRRWRKKTLEGEKEDIRSWRMKMLEKDELKESMKRWVS